MTYTERFSDQERSQIYAELVTSGIGHYPGGEGAVLAEMLSADHVRLPKHKAVASFSWRGFFRLPVFGQPSLT